MTARLRDLDGARDVYVEAREAKVFLWSRDFCYEFDKGLILHHLARELGITLSPHVLAA